MLENVEVYHVDQLATVIQQRAIRLAIVAVPAAAAQAVAEKLVSAGVDGIMNFAPVTVTLPKRVQKVGVDLAIELEQLTFSLVNRMEYS